MGLFGLDANSSSSSLTQAQVTSQYGQAIGANIGKGSASSNASGTTTIGGGIKIGKGSSLVINNSNAQLENSILSGLDNITGLLQNEPQSTLSPTTNAGNAGASGASSSQGDLSGLTTAVSGLINELQNNQATSTANSNALLDQLNAGGSSDVSGVSHPYGGFDFSPSSGGNSTETSQGNGGSIVTGIVIAVITAVVVGIAVKKLKLN